MKPGTPRLIITTAISTVLTFATLAIIQAQVQLAPPVLQSPVSSLQPIYPRQPSTGLVTACRITRVIDGDTVEVEITRTCHVRMLQCWAPESRTKDQSEKARGLDSKEHLQALIADQDQATLYIPIGEDLTDAMTMGRVLGYLWRQGDSKSLSQQQVDSGHATPTK